METCHSVHSHRRMIARASFISMIVRSLNIESVTRDWTEEAEEEKLVVEMATLFDKTEQNHEKRTPSPDYVSYLPNHIPMGLTCRYGTNRNTERRIIVRPAHLILFPLTNSPALCVIIYTPMATTGDLHCFSSKITEPFYDIRPPFASTILWSRPPCCFDSCQW